MSERDVLITGIGLVSSLGEGTEAHWTALSRGRPAPVVDREKFAPYSIHPLPVIDWGNQIPKRGDQRQMETWQRLGTYAAGMALDDAGLKGDEELCATMDMIVAAGGGERDVDVDMSILETGRNRADRDVLLNEKLTTELRPTLFLAQLSNLLAGNISIVHKVTGSSHTFMGEDGAGIAAIRDAVARISSGQSTHILVGASFQTEHPDMLLSYELAGYLERGGWRPLWQREPGNGGGVITGSGGAFLVLESRAHAEARGRSGYARINQVETGFADRERGELEHGISNLLSQLDLPQGPMQVLSGASGAHGPTAAERKVFAQRPGLAMRGFTGLTGHLKEAQFPVAVALAALALAKGETYPPFDAETEAALDAAPEATLATTIGYHLGEGAALLGRA